MEDGLLMKKTTVKAAREKHDAKFGIKQLFVQKIIPKKLLRTLE